MARKTRRELELERQMAQLQAQINLLAIKGTATIIGGKQVVGIKNISSYTIGVMNKIQGEQGEVTLHPLRLEGSYDPACYATISLQFWQQLRKEKIVQQGMIVRDDSHLAGVENIAPPDRTEDIHPEFWANAIADPVTWVESKTDEELREAIGKITSEPTLRRLLATVDHKIKLLGMAYEDDPERAKKAVRDLPSKYRYMEQLALDKLESFQPNFKNYQNESKTTARF